MKTFLPLCAAALLLAVALPLSAAPDGDRGAVSPPLSAAPYTDRGAVLRDEMEARLQLLGDRLSLQQERRLDELKNELHQLREERKTWLDDTQNPIIATAEKKKEEVRATGDRYVSMVGTNFTALGVLAAIIALVPAIFSIANTVSFNESAKQKLNDIERIKQDAQRLREKYLSELEESTQEGISKVEAEAKNKIEAINNLYGEAQQEIEQAKEKIQSVLDITEGKMPSETREYAHTLIKSGKEINVLWGQAILAMSNQDWETACAYWQKIVQQIPDDIDACSNLAKCQTFLAGSNKVTPSQRQDNFEKAFTYYTQMLSKQDTLSVKNKSNIFMRYATLKAIYALYLPQQERLKIRNDAQEYFQRAHNLDSSNVATLHNWALVLYQQSKEESNPEIRHTLQEKAANILIQAQNINNQDASIFALSAEIKQEQAKYAKSSEQYNLLHSKALQLIKTAQSIDPTDSTTLFIFANIQLEQAQKEAMPTERRILLAESAQIAHQAILYAPQKERYYRLLASIKQNQANMATSQTEFLFLINNAEQLLLEAMNLAPLDAENYIELASFKLNLTKKSENAHACKQLCKEAKQLLLQATQLTPYNHYIYYNIAKTMLTKAKYSDRQTRINLYEEAEKILYTVKQIAPRKTTTFGMLAHIKIMQALDSKDKQQSFLADAEQDLNKFPSYAHFQGFYLRSCIAALRGQSDNALELLEECRKSGTLPSREYIESDKALDSLRDQDAFKGFLERAYPAEDDTEDSE